VRRAQVVTEFAPQRQMAIEIIDLFNNISGHALCSFK